MVDPLPRCLLLLVLALCSSVAAFAKLSAAHLDARSFARIVRECLELPHMDRALKFCVAIGDKAPSSRGIKQLLLRLCGAPPTQPAPRYREGDEGAVAEALRALRADYDQTTTPLLRRLSREAGLALGLGWIVLAESALGGVRGELFFLRVWWFFDLLIAVVFCLLIVGGLMLWRIRRGTEQVRKALLEPLARAWLQGGFPLAIPPGKVLSFQIYEPGKPPRQELIPRKDKTIHLGRNAVNHIRFDHPEVEQIHAALVDDGDKIQLMSPGGRTTLNGQRLYPHPDALDTPMVLVHHGDAIQLGPVVLRVGIGDGSGG